MIAIFRPCVIRAYKEWVRYVFYLHKFAFVERSGTMKAPVGLLSDRTVLRSKMEGPRPDKFRFVELSREYHTQLKIAKGRIPSP